MKLILNEQEIIDNALNNGYIDMKKPTSTIVILIKYYLNQDMDKEQIFSSIDDFMKKNYKGYNSVKWQVTIEKIINSIFRDKKEKINIIEIKEIIITESELNTIKEINNGRLEKLSFVLLVYSKIYNNINNNDSNWVNCQLKDIFSDSKIAISPEKQNLMVHKLVELGLVENSKIVDCNNIKILFVNNSDKKVIAITDFRNFVYEYLKWKGEKIEKCEDCGILIKKTGKNQKMCKECSLESRKEYEKIKKREYRS